MKKLDFVKILNETEPLERPLSEMGGNKTQVAYRLYGQTKDEIIYKREYSRSHKTRIVCIGCGSAFLVFHKDAKYCSKKCYWNNKWRNKK